MKVGLLYGFWSQIQLDKPQERLSGASTQLLFLKIWHNTLSFLSLESTCKSATYLRLIG